MKDNDKVTLTYGQLKKLVNERMETLSYKDQLTLLNDMAVLIKDAKIELNSLIRYEAEKAKGGREAFDIEDEYPMGISETDREYSYNIVELRRLSANLNKIPLYYD